jgi:hypothetical protein
MNVSPSFRSCDVGAGLAPPCPPSGMNENNFYPRVIPNPASPRSCRAFPHPSFRAQRDRFLSALILCGEICLMVCLEAFLQVDWTWRGRRGLWRSRFSGRQILAHFFKALRAEPANRQQIVNALERAIRFPHLQDFSAVAGPMPGTCCNSSAVAVLRFTGLTGGFFFPPRTTGEQIKLTKRKSRKGPPGHDGSIMR